MPAGQKLVMTCLLTMVMTTNWESCWTQVCMRVWCVWWYYVYLMFDLCLILGSELKMQTLMPLSNGHLEPRACMPPHRTHAQSNATPRTEVSHVYSQSRRNSNTSTEPHDQRSLVSKCIVTKTVLIWMIVNKLFYLIFFVLCNCIILFQFVGVL